MPGVEVLCHDAAGILDGHVPSAEIHHGGAGRQVRLVELRALQFAQVVPPYVRFEFFVLERGACGHKKAQKDTSRLSASVYT